MPTLVGFSTFAALPEQQITEKISRRILSGDQEMLVWWSIEAGVHVEPHSHANEQIVWMLKGKMEFRLGSEQRVCGPGDVVVIPGGTEHEAWAFATSTIKSPHFSQPHHARGIGALWSGSPARRLTAPPLIVEALARLRSKSCILDGDDGNGMPTFDRIRYRGP
jgi:quercetin dioxygenase-like cupin family protein